MFPVIIATIAAAAIAAVVYLVRERIGLAGVGLAALRTIGLAALFLAFFNPASTSRIDGGSPTVFLDASLSMDATGSYWSAARDTAVALASGGTLLTFGSAVQPYDTAVTPQGGFSRLGDALRVATGRSGPVYVVTDGEIEDAHAIGPSLLGGVSFVVLARDTTPNAALLGVELAGFIGQADTVQSSITIGTWGGIVTEGGTLEVLLGDRLIHREVLSLPASPGTGQRTIGIAASSLPVGTSILRFRLAAPGDQELRDNERLRVLTVTTQPGVVVLVNPADTEGRFLARELSEIVRTGVRGFARISDGVWVDMNDLSHVPQVEVERTANAAALVLSRGNTPWTNETPFWHWPAGTDGESQFFEGDWYVTNGVPASPMAGRLASVAWDSVPPLTGIIPLVPGSDQWIGLSGRLGRRGADRPLLIGEDSSGIRRLTTAGAGMWRWALRGGTSLDAYRSVLASGVDWLLDSDEAPNAPRVAARTAVTRGRAVAFRRLRPDVPDSVTVNLSGPDSTSSVMMVFDASNEARVSLPPGVYTWSIPSVADANGVVAVEEYSDEYHPRPVAFENQMAESGFSLLVRYARDRWWLFALAMMALIGEWAWRQRIGLP